MKIINEFPPNYHDIIEKINIPADMIVVFAYGPTLYNPSGAKIQDHIIVHEETHFRQQLNHSEGIDGWWREYLNDVSFRLSQELEAYAYQYDFVKKNYSSKQVRKFLQEIASLLAGPLYGSMLSAGAAECKIKNKQKRLNMI